MALKGVLGKKQKDAAGGLEPSPEEYTTMIEADGQAEPLTEAEATAQFQTEAPDQDESKASSKGRKSRGRKAKKGETDPDGRPDLSKLKKKELLEILVAQGEEIDALRAKVVMLESQLANREFEMKNVGSIAQASLQVTDIFKEAEEAARIYLENIRRRYV